MGAGPAAGVAATAGAGPLGVGTGVGAGPPAVGTGAGTGPPAVGTGAGAGPPAVGTGAGAGPLGGEAAEEPSAGFTLGAKGERVTRNFGPAPSPGLGGSPSLGVSLSVGFGGCGGPGSVIRLGGRSFSAVLSQIQS